MVPSVPQVILLVPLGTVFVYFLLAGARTFTSSGDDDFGALVAEFSFIGTGAIDRSSRRTDMKKSSVALTILLLAVLQQGLASNSDPPVPSPAELDDPVLPAVPSQIADPDLRSIMRLKPQIFEIQTRAAPSGRHLDNFVGTVKINPAFLGKPAEPTANAAGAVLGFGLPRDMARLQLEVAGDQYELFFFDEQKDARYGLRHVTMSVLNHERSYARFSVDDRNGLIIGAVHTPSHTLRIVPGATAGQQEVYVSDAGRLDSQFSALGEQHTASARLLAWRHQQLESVATIGAEYAEARYESRSSYLWGGNLGDLKRVNAREFVRAAAELASITQFQGGRDLSSFRNSGDRGRRSTSTLEPTDRWCSGGCEQ